MLRLCGTADRRVTVTQEEKELARLNIFGSKGVCWMLIVDAQIHLWEKGTPSPPHRQEPYSAEEAIAAMDQAGVDRALIHPVLWDLGSNELAMQAVRKYPDRFRIMGWFYLDDPNGRDLVDDWKER